MNMSYAHMPTLASYCEVGVTMVRLTQRRPGVGPSPIAPLAGGHLEVLEHVFVGPAEDVPLLEPDELGGALALGPEEDAAGAVFIHMIIVPTDAGAAAAAIVVVVVLAVAVPPIRGGAEAVADAVVHRAVLVLARRGAVLGAAGRAREGVDAHLVAHVAHHVRAVVGLAVDEPVRRERRRRVDRAPVEQVLWPAHRDAPGTPG